MLKRFGACGLGLEAQGIGDKVCGVRQGLRATDRLFGLRFQVWGSRVYCR